MSLCFGFHSEQVLSTIICRSLVNSVRGSLYFCFQWCNCIAILTLLSSEISFYALHIRWHDCSYPKDPVVLILEQSYCIIQERQKCLGSLSSLDFRFLQFSITIVKLIFRVHLLSKELLASSCDHRCTLISKMGLASNICVVIVRGFVLRMIIIINREALILIYWFCILLNCVC